MFLLGKGIWRETIIILCYVYLNSNEIAIFYFVTISIARDELTFPCKLKLEDKEDPAFKSGIFSSKKEHFYNFREIKSLSHTKSSLLLY